VWWEGYGIEHFIQDAGNLTQDQISTIMRGLADFTLLQSLRLGFIPPPNYTQGIARLTRWLPRITDCIRRGWQPVSGVRALEPLWAARYGVGLDTVLVVAHETGKPAHADLHIENARLRAPGRILFADARGRPLRNTFPADGDVTVVPVNVPVRTPQLLEAAAAVEGGPDAPFPLLRATVTVTRDVTRRVVRIRLEPVRPGVEVRVRFSRPAGMQPAAVTLAGRRLERETGPCAFRLEAPAVLVAEFASDLFRCTDAALFNFPFVRDGKPACTILVPENAGPHIRGCAFRIQEYWRYWYGRALKPGRDVRIPIRTGAPPPAESAAAVVLRIDAAATAPGEVAIHGNRLVIQARNGAAIEKVVSRLLDALDRRHFFPDRIPGSKLNNEVGLGGKVLLPNGLADSATELRNFPLLP